MRFDDARATVLLVLVSLVAGCAAAVPPGETDAVNDSAATDVPAVAPDGSEPERSTVRLSLVAANVRAPAAVRPGSSGVNAAFYAVEAGQMGAVLPFGSQRPCATSIHPPGAPTVSGGGLALETTRGTLNVPERPVGRVLLDSATALWQPGEVIRVRSEGNVVPAFAAAVEIPPPVEFTTPTPASVGEGYEVRVARSSALRVAWSGSVPLVRIVISGYDTSTPGRLVILRCLFTGSAGAGTIPVEWLERVPRDEAAVLQVSSTDLREMQAGPFPIELRADNIAVVARVVWE